MSARAFVNGVADDRVGVDDRGFNYGDGAFETLLVSAGTLIWWDPHMARLARACEVLGLRSPEPRILLEEARSLASGQRHAALKLVLTRGSSGRGYGPDAQAMTTRVLSLHPAPRISPGDAATGICVRRCAMRLSTQPRLAGLKHLNRLDQVLARAEWSDESIHEGIMCDLDGRPVSATAANLFVVRAGQLLTPALEQCGVAGIARDWILQRNEVEIRPLDWEELESADELFLSSSLRGILPVARLDGQPRSAGPMTRKLQSALWREVPALSPVGVDA